MYVPQGKQPATMTKAMRRLAAHDDQTHRSTTSDGIDIGAVVAEIGAHAAKLGFAGEDQPRAYFPSHTGYLSPDDSAMDTVPPAKNNKHTPRKEYKFDLGHNDERLEVHNPLSGGLINDWDMVEQIWQHANKTALSVDFAHTPLLLIERAFAPPKLRHEYVELMFEKFQSPALFMAKDSVLSCFACGKTTGLVVDIGAETSTVAPVQDGWLEAKGLVRSRLGGRMVDRYLLSLLEKNGVVVQPFLRQPPAVGGSRKGGGGEGMSASFREYATLEVVRGLKESVCRMPEVAFSLTDSKFSAAPKVNYELPDGVMVAAGIERFRAAEIYMCPEPAWECLPGAEGEEGGEEGGKEEDWSREALPKMVADAVLKCERDQLSPLLNSIVLAGGGACVEGTMERLKSEVETAIYGEGQGGYGRVKVIQAGAQERKICAWLGGSIVASLGSFHEMWVSKAEYAERGAGVIDAKCP